MEEQLSFAVNWTAVGAVATAIAALVALSLPFLQSSMRRSQARRMIARELRENSKCISQMIGFYDGHVGPIWLDRELGVDASVKRLQVEVWSHFRWSLGHEQYRCFYPFFASILDIIDPDKAVARSDTAEMDLERLNAIRISAAREFAEQYEKTAPVCRFFKD